MSQYLPPGCTDSMCEPEDPICASCGCLFSAHYYEDGEEPKGDLCSRDSSAEGIEMMATGEVAHACDSLIGGLQCDCEGYVEGEYEPDYDEERKRYDDLD